MSAGEERTRRTAEGWFGDLYRIRVRWDDTDTTQRVYLGRYIKWLDDAVTEFLRARGMVFDPDGGLRLNGRRIRESFVVGEYGCRIERSSLLDDLIDVKVRVLERRSRVVVFEGELVDQKGRRVARGVITYICVRGSGGRIRSAPIPTSLAARL
ncbi:MAG: acyl-CoA thioesterase [Thermoplasmata archaeon]